MVVELYRLANGDKFSVAGNNYQVVEQRQYSYQCVNLATGKIIFLGRNVLVTKLGESNVHC